MRWRLLLAASVGLAACGGAGRLAGQSCQSDGDCSIGLRCMVFTAGAGASCDTSLHACSLPCQTTADCASLGASFTCFADCSGTPSFCGELAQ